MKHFITSTAATIALAFTLASSPASAYDHDTYAGTACQPYIGSQAGDFTTAQTALYNKSSSGRWVSCPIVSDDGNRYRSIAVSHVAPSGNTVNMSCYVFNANYGNNGASAYWGSSRSSGSYSTLFINNPYHSATYYQNLWCYLPPGARLNWYSVDTNPPLI